MLKVAMIPGKGRGILANRAIAAGALIEKAPAARMPSEERHLIDQTDVFTYYFADPGSYARKGQYDCLLAFGLSSLCNHAEKPNAVVSWTEDTVGLWASLIALEDIAPDQEVTVFYTNITEYESYELFI